MTTQNLQNDIENEYIGETSPRNRWVALVLTMLHPALGYMYVGLGKAAVLSAVFFLGYLALFMVAWSLLKFFPFWPLLVFVAGWELLTILCLVGVLRAMDTHEKANNSSKEYLLRSYNHPVVYTLVMLLAAVVPLYGAYHTATQVLWGIVQVNDNSMYPALQSGDVLLVDRSAFWNRAPDRGEMVVLSVEASDESGAVNHVRLGRIIAQAGDQVRLEGDSVLVNEERLQRLVYADNTHEDGAREAPVYIERNAGRSYLIAGEATPPPVDMSGEPIEVNDDRLLIIGDNRAYAMNKRMFWTVNRDQVLGKPSHLLYAYSPEGSEVRVERSGLRIR